MNVSNKIKMYSLYEEGAFGNRFECWPDLKAMLCSDVPDGQLNIRHKTNGLSGFLYMNLTRKEARNLIESGKVSESECHFTAGDQSSARYRTFQGEVFEDANGWSLHYSRAKMPMRPALLEYGQFAEGLRARLFIKHFMDSRSFENLLELFDRFPGHVVEFTCFSRSVGVLGWNTVFWEVRNY